MTTAPSISLPQWQEKRSKRTLRTSVSAIEMFEQCKRKWWLKHVRGLPEAQRQAQTFGTVLHAVIERFVRADNRGIDPQTGQIVNLYPEGWEVARNRFTGEIEGKIGLPEQAHLKIVFAKAIEEGLIGRWPGRQIEQDFELALGSHDEVAIVLTGFIDLFTDERVEDHKSCKDKRYAKSGKALADSVQMMTYAKMLLEKLRAEGKPIPEYITLRHNSFGSQAAWIKKSEIRVTPAQIDNFWNARIVTASREMVEIRRRVDRWHHILQPRDYPNPCNAYGGCAFRSICLAQEDEDKYEKRLGKMAEMGYTSLATQPGVPSPQGTAELQTPETKDETNMGIADRFALKGAITGATPAPQINPQPVQQPAVSTVTANTNPPGTPVVGFKIGLRGVAGAQTQQPVQTTAQVQAPANQPTQTQQTAAAAPVQAAARRYEGDRPQWADANCPVCKGDGFNAAGAVCRLCESKAAKDPSKIPPDKFLVGNEPDLTLWWTPREGIAPAHAVAGSCRPIGEQAPTVRATVNEAPAPSLGQQLQETIQQGQQPASGYPVTVGGVTSVPASQTVPTGPTQAQIDAAAAQAKARADADAQAAAEKAKADAAAAAKVNPAAAAGKDPVRNKGGRPKESLKLLIGVRMIGMDGLQGSGRHVYELPEILQQLHENMLVELRAAGQDITSIYETDDFQRRNAIAARGKEIADIIKSDWVFCPPCSTASDLAVLLAALRPFASIEVIPSL